VLSDREREILQEVQRQFVTEEPDLVRSFTEVGRRGDSTFSLPRAYEVPRWAYTAALIVSVAFSVLMLLALAPWTALVFMVLAIVIAVARFRRCDAAHRVSAGRSGADRPTSQDPHQW
jgi:Flp pilus assembly protein TadB